MAGRRQVRAALQLQFLALVIVGLCALVATSSSAQSFQRVASLTASPSADKFRGGCYLGGGIAAFATYSVPASLCLFNISGPGLELKEVVLAATAEVNFFGVFPDLTKQFALAASYVVLDNAPGLLVKFSLFPPARIGSASGIAGEGRFVNGDMVNSSHAVVITSTQPGYLILFDVDRMERITRAEGNTDLREDAFNALLVDRATMFAYCGTRMSPSRVVKFNLGDMTRVTSLLADPGEDRFQGAVLVGDFAYFGTASSPGKVVKIDVRGDMARVDAAVGAIGENNFFTGLSDGAGGLYFGTSGPSTPATVVKFTESPFERVESAVAASGEESFFSSVTDGAGSIVFGTSTDPGIAVKFKVTVPTTATTTTTPTTTTRSTTTTPTTTTATTTTPTTTAPPPTTTSSTTAEATTAATTESLTTPATTSSGATETSTTTALATAATTAAVNATTSLTNTTTTTASSTVESTTTTTTAVPVVTTTTTTTLPTTTTATTTTSPTSTTTTTTTIHPTPVPNPFANFTSPGLADAAQRSMRNAVFATSITASVASGSPSSSLVASRAMAAFALAGCPVASSQGAAWAYDELSFPYTFFPGVAAGSAVGGHYRMASVGFLLGMMLCVALVCVAWAVVKRKVITTRPTWLERGTYLLATAPIPYAFGIFLAQIVGVWAQSSGLLGTIDGGDGAFVDVVLLSALPWCVIACMTYRFARLVQATAFPVTTTTVVENKHPTGEVHDGGAVAPMESDPAHHAEPLLTDHRTHASSSNAAHSDNRGAPVLDDRHEAMTSVTAPPLIGVVTTCFYVVPVEGEAQWFYEFKVAIAAWLSSERGRFYIAGYYTWKLRDEVESDKAAEAKTKSVAAAAAATDVAAWGAANATCEETAATTVNTEEEKKSTHRKSADVVDDGDFNDDDGDDDALTNPGKNFITRFRSLVMNMIGPPLPDELEHSSELRAVSPYRFRLAPFTFPFMCVFATCASMAQGIAKGNMERYCGSALLVIVIANVLAAAFSLLVRPFVVPLRNVIACTLDTLIALSSIVALAGAGSGSGVEIVQVVTGTCVTIGAILELVLTLTRAAVFAVLRIRLGTRTEYARHLRLHPELAVAAMNKSAAVPLASFAAALWAETPEDMFIVLGGLPTPRRRASPQSIVLESASSDDEPPSFPSSLQARNQRFVPLPTVRLELDLAEVEDRARAVEAECGAAVAAVQASSFSSGCSSDIKNVALLLEWDELALGSGGCAGLLPASRVSSFAASAPSPLRQQVDASSSSAASRFLVQQQTALAALLYHICEPRHPRLDVL